MVTSALAKAIQEHIHPVMSESGLIFVRTKVYEENVSIRTHIYKARWSTDEVEHFVYLSEIRKRETVLKSEFGIRNSIAEVFSCHILRSYGGGLFNEIKCDEPDSCTMRFSFARLDQADWVLRVPDLRRSEIGERYHDFIRDHLVPTIGRVTTLQDFLSLLATNSVNCPWYATNGAIRAAQIVAVARQIGLDTDHILSVLESRKEFIANGGTRASRIASDPDGFVVQMLDDWTAGSYNTAGATRTH